METKFFLSCIALLLGTLLPLPPQSMFASITGTITDPSGAAVAGAPVVAVHRDSNYRYATTSNTSGAYTIEWVGGRSGEDED